MQSGVSRADKSRLDVGNRERGGKRASREGAAGNVGEVGFQDQVRERLWIGGVQKVVKEVKKKRNHQT